MVKVFRLHNTKTSYGVCVVCMHHITELPKANIIHNLSKNRFVLQHTHTHTHGKGDTQNIILNF